MQKDNIMYKPNVITTYLYPGLHFAMGLISKAAAIDPIIVYAKFRYVLGFLSMPVIYTFSKTLFRSGYIASIVTLTAVALIYNGVATQIPGYYCGQLVPVSHISDIAMGILLPLSLLFTFKYVNSDKGILSPFAFLAPLMVMTTTIIHVREGFQMLFYYAITLGAFLVFNRQDKKVIYKIAVLIIAVTLLGLIYMPVHRANQPLLIWEGVELPYKQWVAGELLNTISGPLNIAFSPIKTGGLGWEGLPHVSLALFLAPLMLLWHRKYFWGLFLGTTILASFILARFKVLSLMAILLTYSEIMISPVRFALFFSYITFGLLIFGILTAADKLLFALRRFASNRQQLLVMAGLIIMTVCLFFAFVIPPLMRGADTAVYFYGGILLLVMAIVLLVTCYIKRLDRAQAALRNIFDNPKPHSVVFTAVLLISLLFTIYISGGIQGRGLLDEYRSRVAAAPDITSFEAYYKQTAPTVMPFALVQYIRDDIEPHNVFAYDRLRLLELSIPMMANQYVQVTGARMNMKVVDDDYLGKYKNERPIIFSTTEFESVGDKLNYIYEFNFTYILLDPDYHNSLSAIFDRYCCFKKVYDDKSFALYKIDREQLKSTLLNLEK